MPTCIKCSNVQAKLNNGNLYKTCFSKEKNSQINDSFISQLNDETNNDAPLDERDERYVIDLNKESMLQEKRWNVEIT